MKYAFLKEKDNKAIFVGDYMECYVPQSYFDKGMASTEGECINVLGVFNLRVATSDKQDISKLPLKTFNVPTMISMKPTVIERKELSLTSDSKPEIYSILKFYNGDELMTTLEVAATVDNTELFMMKLLTEGKVPSTIKYGDVFLLYLRNLELNNMNLDTPGAVLSVIVSETYRYNKDNAIPLRKVLGKGKCTELDYNTANMRAICSYSSTFAGMTFEDLDAMIISAVNKKRYNSSNAYSPVEKIIK
ncbi:hypothetical protein V6O07_24075 [Arthrospira platensis SPKY2]